MKIQRAIRKHPAPERQPVEQKNPGAVEMVILYETAANSGGLNHVYPGEISSWICLHLTSFALMYRIGSYRLM